MPPVSRRCFPLRPRLVTLVKVGFVEVNDPFAFERRRLIWDGTFADIARPARGDDRAPCFRRHQRDERDGRIRRAKIQPAVWSDAAVQFTPVVRLGGRGRRI